MGYKPAHQSPADRGDPSRARLGLLLVLLYVPPVAHLLGHSGPSIAGFAFAATTIPAVLLADALQKRYRNHHTRDFRL